MRTAPPPSTATVTAAHRLAAFLHPTRSHYIAPWQPVECRAVVGPSRAASKVDESNRVRVANADATRAASQRAVERGTFADCRRAQAQRSHIEQKMRRVASLAARSAKRSDRCDDVVEAALVSARSVSVAQRAMVVDGLAKLLPARKHRPPLV